MTSLDQIRPAHVLPPINGRYKDRNPDIRSAGKNTIQGDETVSACLNEPTKEIYPETVKKFSKSWRPDAGEIRVFYGMAHDPQLQKARQMTHGIAYPRGVGAAGSLNPTPLTLYQQRFLDRLESNSSNSKKPLGKVPDAKKFGRLPANLDTENQVFGVTVEKIGSAGELLNPPLTRAEIDSQAEEDHHTYLRSHKALLAGEQAHRLYTNSFKPELRYGQATPHDNTGKAGKQCLNWVTNVLAEKKTPLVETRLDAFRERTQPVLGQPLDPIKDTMKVGPDHTFGVLHKPDSYGVGDLLHGRAPRHFLRGEDRRRSLIAAVRSQLKQLNFQNFADLQQAFLFYDKTCTGKISAQDLIQACTTLGLFLDDSLLTQLIDYCDVNEDGVLDYKEFSNFLNWRELSIRSAPTFGGKTRADPEHLSRQIDQSVTHLTTTNSMYGAYPTPQSLYRTYGVPTVRSDLGAPAFKRVSDRTSYGNEGGAGSCLNPNLFSVHGVTELDLMMPRTKSEILDIYSQAKIPLTSDQLSSVFSASYNGLVSLQDFKTRVEELQASGLL